MKKLMIAAAIVCAAVVSQAAAVGWNCAGANDYAGGDYSIFVIGEKGVTSVAQIQAIVEAGGLAAASAYAFGGGVVSDMGLATLTSTSSGKSIKWNGNADPGETHTGFIFVENAAGDEASYTATADIVLKNDTTGKNFAFGNQGTNFTNNNFAVAPEPTSGLLLLLGVAGLALKRRRA